MVAVHDTLTITKTITIRENEQGDTVFRSEVTDRTRASVRDRVKDVEVRIVEKTDTVYVAVRDSVQVTTTNLSNPTNKNSNFVRSLKWIFALICAIVVLIITVRIGLRRFLL